MPAGSQEESQDTQRPRVESELGRQTRRSRVQRELGDHNAPCIGDRRSDFKATISPQHVKHRSEAVAKMSQDLAKEHLLETKRHNMSTPMKSASESGSPARARDSGSLSAPWDPC